MILLYCKPSTDYIYKCTIWSSRFSALFIRSKITRYTQISIHISNCNLYAVISEIEDYIFGIFRCTHINLIQFILKEGNRSISGIMHLWHAFGILWASSTSTPTQSIMIFLYSIELFHIWIKTICELSTEHFSFENPFRKFFCVGVFWSASVIATQKW